MHRVGGFALFAAGGMIFWLAIASGVSGQTYFGTTSTASAAGQTTSAASPYVFRQPTLQQTPQQAAQQPTAQQEQLRRDPRQQESVRQQPIRMQTFQTPPKTVIQNGVTVYRQDPNQTAQYPATPYRQTQFRADDNRTGEVPRTMPTGFGSPYPTGLDPNAIRVASTQTDPNRSADSVYDRQPDPARFQAVPGAVSASGHPPAGNVYVPPTPGVLTPGAPHSVLPQPAAPGREGAQRVHVGRSEPPNRVVPFFPTPEEQRELDEFLVRWEEYGKNIKRYDVDFELWIYDPTNPVAIPGKPLKRPFGSFKYIAPNRFVYHVDGEWIEGAKLKRDKNRPRIVEEKIMIDGKSVFYYDYNAESVRQINIPPELIGKGIADSPLPLIFGARADDMKKRFSMKIVTAPQRRDKEIWLRARPLLMEDRQEFQEIEIRLDKKNLRAIALKKDDVNGKAYDVYVFENVKINNRIGQLFEDLKQFFVPEIPKGWKHEVVEYAQIAPPDRQPAAGTHSVVAAPAASPHDPRTPSRNEIPLYSPGK